MKNKRLIPVNLLVIITLLLANCEAPESPRDSEPEKEPGYKNENTQPEKPGTTEGMPEAGQGEITDETLTKFVKINDKLQVAQATMNKRVTNAIEDKGVTVEEYQAAVNTPQPNNNNTEASPLTQEKTNAITKEIQAIRSETQQKYNTIIESYGLTMNEYQQLSAAVQQDPSLQQRFKKLQKN